MTHEEEFDKIYDALPEDVKEAMTAVNTVNILTAMKSKYNLHIDQLGELSGEVGLLMVGAVRPQEFIGKIEASLHIPRETAKLIATEVNEKIFRPVRESLMQIHKMNDAKEAVGEKAPAMETTMPSAEISQIHSIKDNMKNKTEETFPEKTKIPEIKTTADNKLTEPFSEPKKTSAPDPYRESPI